MAKVNGLDIVRIPINGKNTLRVMRNGNELWNWTGLPSGYTKLSYIESTGYQYLDTEFIPTNKTKIKYDFSFTKTSTQYSGLLVASSSYLAFGIGSKLELYLGNAVNTSLSPSTNRCNISIDIQEGSFVVDNVTIFSGISFAARGESLPIFALRRSSGYTNYAYMKLYSCQIYDNGNLVRDFVPCKNSSGVCGLYDKVNKKFYSSASSTPFTGA